MTQELPEFLLKIWPVLIAGALTFLASYGLYRAIRLVVRRLNKGQSFSELKRLKSPIITLLTLIAVYTTARLSFENLHDASSTIFQIALIFTSAMLMIRALAVGRYFIGERFDMGQADNLKARKVYTQIRVFERILSVVILVIALALALMTFEEIRQIGASILASAGILSVIVGLAAQKLIANLLAGFQIAVTQPIRLEDVVIMEGEWGWIEEITLSYVVVRVWDKRRLIVPSAQVMEKPFQNWTRSTSELLGTVFMHVDYRMPIAPLREALSKILAETDLWDQKVSNIQVTNLTDRSMELRIMVSAKDAPTAWDLRVHVREKVVEYLQAHYPEYLPRSRVVLENTPE